MTAEFGVDSQHCVSVWSVNAVSVCGQSALCQCVDSQRQVRSARLSDYCEQHGALCLSDYCEQCI